MEPTEPIVIEFSRVKMAGIFAASALFVSLGIWFWLKPGDVAGPVLPDVRLVQLVGVLSVILFSGVGVFVLKKLNDKRPAVIISNEGITDNSSASSPGFIPWAEVIAISEFAYARNRSVSIHVKDPTFYFEREPKALKRRLMKSNHKLTGAVTSISANGLQCHYHQLKTLLEDGLATYRSSLT